ncbi:MAG TPA: hypothetical protein VHC46_01930 [Thermodesulfobacteriota bacterium]|nr:hypothetical protein [Thermodesulfobacteriota bacterium]
MADSEETLDSYLKKMEDQEMKGLLLKLRNELRKPDASWESVRSVLAAVNSKSSRVLSEIAPLIIK